jgi:hypothetical protein
LFTANVTTSQGHYNNDKFQGHWIQLEIATTGSGTGIDRGVAGVANATWINSTIANLRATNPVTDGTNGTPRTGNETAPKSLGVNFVIKY